MLVDIRYHIITIIIIFVTLAIGILIGSSMVGNDLIIQEQKNLISRLEEDFSLLRKENKEFKREVNSLEGRLASNIEFQKMILPLVVNGQLKDEKLLLIIGDNISKDLKEKVIQTLQLASVKQLKVFEEELDIEDNFNKIILLGQANDQIKDKHLQVAEKVMKIGAKDLKSISGLIKLVFQIASKDLERLRSVTVE